MKWYSIMQDKKECYISGRTDMLECHHIFGGANRKNSTKYGLVVWLNHYYHNEPKCPENLYHGSPHHDAEVMQWLRQQGQKAFEKTHTREEFLTIFGKNYLFDDDEVESKRKVFEEKEEEL